MEGGEGGREGEEGEEEVTTEPVTLLKCNKLKVWEMVESENVSEEFVCQCINKLQVDDPKVGAGEELPEHALSDVAPSGVENIKFF